jgi:hypothetical protein
LQAQFDLMPENGRDLPSGSDVAQDEPEELQRCLIAGEVTPELESFADATMQGLKGIGGVDYLANDVGEGEEQDDVFPVPLPNLNDHRTLLPPGTGSKPLELLPCQFGSSSEVDGTKCLGDGFSLLPRTEVHRIPEEMHDTGLDAGMGEDSLRCLGKTFETVDNSEQEVLSHSNGEQTLASLFDCAVWSVNKN